MKIYDSRGDYYDVPYEDYKLFIEKIKELCSLYNLTPVSADGDIEVGFVGGYYNGGTFYTSVTPLPEDFWD